MAASSLMQSILVSPVVGVAKGLGSNRLSPYCHMPHQRRSSSVAVRCKAEVSTDFVDVFAFSGPAPGRINGRLAMIGFVAAINVELSKGEDVFAQISNSGIPWFLLTTVVLSVASLIPLFSGVTAVAKPEIYVKSNLTLIDDGINQTGKLDLEAYSGMLKETGFWVSLESLTANLVLKRNFGGHIKDCKSFWRKVCGMSRLSQMLC